MRLSLPVYMPFSAALNGFFHAKPSSALIICTLHASGLIHDFCRQIFALKAEIPASPWPVRVMGDKKMTAALTA